MNEEAPLDVDAGLPGSREAWPAGLLSHLERFAQGHVVEKPPLFYFADPTRPVWARTRAYTEGSEGPEVVQAGRQTAPRYGLILSQTCDIAEVDAELPIRPWIQLCPIYDLAGLAGGMRKLLLKGKGHRYLLHLPALADGFWVADLRIELPVEKGWLAGREPIEGFADEASRRVVGERLAVLRSRPAFASAFVRGVQAPLVAALRRLKSEQPELFDAIDLSVEQVLVDLDSFLTPTQARLVVLIGAALSPAARVWLEEWWDDAAGAAAVSGFTLHALDIRSQDAMTVREYRGMTVMPLDRVSPQ